VLDPIQYATTSQDPRLRDILSRSIEFTPDLEASVNHIVSEVEAKGDEAVLAFTKEFDRVELTADRLIVSEEELASAERKADPALIKVIREAAENIQRFHDNQRTSDWTVDDGDGVILGKRIVPIEKVGLLVPGASAPLFSTLLMGAIPAKIAGVSHIAVATPPQSNGDIHPAVLAAAQIAGVDRVYRAFGAQAVAALAFGTDTFTRVDKLVGPGHPVVQIAKKRVFGRVDIDMVAGPSEIVVVADQTSNPRHVAADMLSQAEHGSGYEAAVCITPDADIAGQVAEELDRQLADLSHKEAAEKALSRYGAIVITKDLNQAVELVNEIAPEHVELIVEDPWALQTGIKHAGAIFMGPASSEPVGDYFAGTNHILPTAGAARYASSVGVNTFLKDISLISYTGERLKKTASSIIQMAEAEGLDGHANAIRLRLQTPDLE
jgi:histidinol dehydrogenase